MIIEKRNTVLSRLDRELEILESDLKYELMNCNRPWEIIDIKEQIKDLEYQIFRLEYKH